MASRYKFLLAIPPLPRIYLQLSGRYGCGFFGLCPSLR